MEIRPGRRRQLLRENGGKPGLLARWRPDRRKTWRAPIRACSAWPTVASGARLGPVDLAGTAALARQVAQAAAVGRRPFDSALVAEVASSATIAPSTASTS